MAGYEVHPINSTPKPEPGYLYGPWVLVCLYDAEWRRGRFVANNTGGHIEVDAYEERHLKNISSITHWTHLPPALPKKLTIKGSAA